MAKSKRDRELTAKKNETKKYKSTADTIEELLIAIEKDVQNKSNNKSNIDKQER